MIFDDIPRRWRRRNRTQRTDAGEALLRFDGNDIVLRGGMTARERRRRWPRRRPDSDERVIVATDPISAKASTTHTPIRSPSRCRSHGGGILAQYAGNRVPLCEARGSDLRLRGWVGRPPGAQVRGRLKMLRSKLLRRRLIRRDRPRARFNRLLCSFFMEVQLDNTVEVTAPRWPGCRIRALLSDRRRDCRGPRPPKVCTRDTHYGAS